MILACLCTAGIRISWKKLLLEREHGGGDALLVHYILWKVSLRKLS